MKKDWLTLFIVNTGLIENSQLTEKGKYLLKSFFEDKKKLFIYWK
jgi:hypothetical protein